MFGFLKRNKKSKCMECKKQYYEEESTSEYKWLFCSDYCQDIYESLSGIPAHKFGSNRKKREKKE